MTVYRYPGLFGDSRSGRLWPTVVLSVSLHIALFWSFSRFHIRPIDRVFYAPIQMVELAGAGRPPSPARTRAAAPAPPPAAPSRNKPTTEIEEPLLRPTPPLRTAPEAKEVPKPAPKPAPSQKPLVPEPAANPAGPKIQVASKQEKPEPVPPKSASQEPSDAAKPAVVRPLKPQPDPAAEERSAEVRRKLEEQREAALRSRIASLRKEETATGKEDAPSGIADLRKRLRGSEAGSASPADATGGSVGIRGTGGSVLQDVRLRVYYDALEDAVRRNWAIPPAMEGKGYRVIMSFVLNRQGKIVDERGRLVDDRGEPIRPRIEASSGNAVFDQLAQRAIEVASSKGLLAFPRGISGETLEVGFQFEGR